MRGWLSRQRRRRLSEAGYAAIMVALIVPTIGIGCAAVAVDTGTWYVEMQMAQKAADAAALAGVPYLPQDLPSARARALEVAARNGFDDADSDTTVTAALGEKATQLEVTVTRVVKNTFGAVIGVPTITISRSGTADYQGPAPMGSPCNTFGNEPNAGNQSVVLPVGTANGSSACSREPQLWATVEGPDTDKVYGDRYQTKQCSSGVDGCTSGNNAEYDDFGYVFVVKVAATAVNTTMDLQLYDPMYINTGLTCQSMPNATSFPVDTVAHQNTAVNPFVTNKDAVNRYSKDGAYTGLNPGDNYTKYCTGDFPTEAANAMTTSFALRQQTDTQNPKIAPVQNDTGGNPCIKQYGSVTTAPTAAKLTSTNSGYLTDQVVGQFHNWVSFCKFTPTRAGDYYLQVRSNVKMYTSGSGSIRAGNPKVLDATGESGVTGEGVNSFAIRAVTASGQEQAVAVSGYNHMPIYVNAAGASPSFYLIRVLPGAAGQKISFSYYDIGDAASAGAVTVQTPLDATGTITSVPFPGGCTAYGGSAGGTPSSQTVLTGCSAPFVQDPASSANPKASKNNGKTETITIPIPNDYSCNYASQLGCWYHVSVNFGTGTVNDITTWDATVIGDPVRLIE